MFAFDKKKGKEKEKKIIVPSVEIDRNLRADLYSPRSRDN